MANSSGMQISEVGRVLALAEQKHKDILLDQQRRFIADLQVVNEVSTISRGMRHPPLHSRAGSIRHGMRGRLHQPWQAREGYMRPGMRVQAPSAVALGLVPVVLCVRVHSCGGLAVLVN